MAAATSSQTVSTRAMRAKLVGYWIATSLLTAELVLGGIWDILRIPLVRDVVAHLGYPTYFLVLLGIWKLLGAAALLVPRFSAPEGVGLRWRVLRLLWSHRVAFDDGQGLARAWVSVCRDRFDSGIMGAASGDTPLGRINGRARSGPVAAQRYAQAPLVSVRG